MIRPWIFEFLYAPGGPGEDVAPEIATALFDAAVTHWQHIERLGFEGIFFSEHHFGLSYSPSPNLLIAAIARSTERLRLGTMGMVLPLYHPWRVLEEIGMLDHLTGGRLEIGCASGVPQELNTARAGDFAPPRFPPEDTIAVVGLIRTKGARPRSQGHPQAPYRRGRRPHLPLPP